MTQVISLSLRRKRLGQYFTGDRLARVLAALAEARLAKTIVDPMGGSGDMLAACLRHRGQAGTVAAIEIDPDAARACAHRLSSLADGLECSVVTGSAFDHRSWRHSQPWDLVITNPPYVRYQVGNSHDHGIEVPTAAEVRAGLLECIDAAKFLGPEERTAFRECAARYSGLSDLAVPAWLLCASRVAIGGRLAMIVPDTWLTRDYSAPVVYILRRFFDIEFVVSDQDVRWFSEALVRTTLVVARRVADKGSAYRVGGHLRIFIPSSIADESSLVGAMFEDAATPEMEFAAWARAQLATRGLGAEPGLTRWSDEQDLISALRQKSKLFLPIEPQLVTSENGAAVPERLAEIVGEVSSDLVRLEQLGWFVGQGLRTGANEFFYVGRAGFGAFQSAITGDASLYLPAGATYPAVRRQSDLPTDGTRIVRDIAWEVLFLDGWILPEDLDEGEGEGERGNTCKLMDADLARLVRMAAVRKYSRNGRSLFLPELSAVKTNVRHKRGEGRRQWYHLPMLTSRHRPSLFLPRVNDAPPLPYINPNNTFIVDANFSTLWADDERIQPHAILALLSSSWVRCWLELTATVLGGGALKVEATHLRRILLPTPSEPALARLTKLGEDISNTPGHGDQLREIDDVVFDALLPLLEPSARTRIEALGRELRDVRLQ